MGSEVVVVKRNRRRAFALLWAAPAWLRSVAVGARTLLDAKGTAASTPRHAATGNGPLRHAPSDAISATMAMTIPVLSRNAEGDHACTGCQRCAEACPSRCLEISGTSESVGDVRGLGGLGSTGSLGVERFTLDLARCIGCGDCVAVCPESALRAEPLGPDSLACASGDPGLRRDLLAGEATA